MATVSAYTGSERASKKELAKAALTFVEDVGDSLNRGWEKTSNSAIKKAIKAFGSRKSAAAALNALVKSLGTSMDGVLTKTAMTSVKKETRTLYKLVKGSQSAKYDIGFKVGSIDQKVISAVAEDSPFWIGSFYDRQLSARIAEIGHSLVVEGGMSVEAGAKEMHKVLSSEFALKGGSSYESTIPSPFSGRVGTYNRILTANSASRIRNYADISAMHSAGIKRYEISAVMDKRTSRICQNMNGRVFTVKQGMSLLERYAIAESPEEFVEITPWVSATAMTKIAGTGNLASQSEKLSAAGLNLPPYHGLCRTIVLVHGV